MRLINKKYLLVFSCFVISLLLAMPALAAYEKYDIGSLITIGEFVYDDDFQATTSPCTISIYNPSGGVAA